MTTAATRSISLVTPIPGPHSRDLVARREAAVVNGLYKATPLAVERAEGALVYDADGNTLIDMVGGIGTLAVGHCPPTVVAAMQAQAERLIHLSALVGTYEPYVELCERLNAAVPISGPCKTLLGNSGAEGVENAIKIARAATGRSAVIAFEGGYHGRTLLTLSLTSKTSFKKSFGPFAPEVYRAPYPYAYQCLLCRGQGSEDGCSLACYEQLERMLLSHVGAENLAAVIIEPVQGEGGFIPVPAAYMRKLRALCDRLGAVLIADEVQCGFGRTGTLYAIEQTGVEPDIIVSAKSLAAGMPLAATTGRAHIMDRAHVGGVGGTYGGNPLACVAALAALDILDEQRLLERARTIGARVQERAAAWQRDIGGRFVVGEVRAMGAMIALELVKSHATREPAVAETQVVLDHMLQHGVIAMRAGLYTNCVRLLVPLIVSDAQLEEGLDVLEDALRAASQPEA
ncbi:MAG: aspartate aminotransferase family protein [Chloroflexales bacterium]|nr:aspartate aminotransferase family protein [Chloroflexales bacterium]